MKLNPEHIELLYAFTEKHFVEWYDVQTELVDHLANGIEQQWEKEPKMTFDEALNKEFKKFGVMGFSTIVEERTKALSKRYWKLIWTYFKTYFKFPKVVLSLLLIWCYYQILVFSMQYHVNWVVIPTLTFLFGIPWYILIKEHRRLRKIKRLTGKKWLFDQTMAQLGGLVYLMNFGIYFQAFFHVPEVWSGWLSLVFSGGVVMFSMVLYTAIAHISPRLRDEMSKQHPEYQVL